MTATSDFMPEQQPYRASTGTVDGARMIWRGVQRISGVALVVAASGLWIAPGADWSNDVMLMKMGLSVTALMVGFWLLLSGVRPPQPNLEIDTDRGEVRLVRPGTMGSPLVLHRCRFADLARVELSGYTLKFWDERSGFVADVHVADRATLDRLLSGLRDAGQTVSFKGDFGRYT